MTPIVASLGLLTPYEIDRPKIRVGPNTDGGYIMAGPLRPEQTVLSYGISTEFRFDEEMARRGHHVHMFDHTIEPLSPDHPNMHFFSEGVAGSSLPHQRLFSIEDHLAKNHIEGDDLILKIDVEGAEFETFKAMEPSTLCRFEQIVMEVHNLDRLEDASFREDFDAAFSKINQYFTLFHVHANNFDGDRLMVVGGLPVAGLMELSYVSTAKVNRGRNMTVYPMDMDFPCVYKRDKLLWFFPFLPTDQDLSSFIASDKRVGRMHDKLEELKNTQDRHLNVEWYRLRYKDLATCTDQYLHEHFYMFGIKEGRFGSAQELEDFEQGR